MITRLPQIAPHVVTQYGTQYVSTTFASGGMFPDTNVSP